jgi:hypothetical protein
MVMVMNWQSSSRPQLSTNTVPPRRQTRRASDSARLTSPAKLKRIDGRDNIEALIGEEKLLHLANLDARAGKTPARHGDEILGTVDTGDLGAAVARQRQRASGAAADVEQFRAGANARQRQRLFEHRPPGGLLQLRPVVRLGAPQLALDPCRAHWPLLSAILAAILRRAWRARNPLPPSAPGS